MAHPNRDGTLQHTPGTREERTLTQALGAEVTVLRTLRGWSQQQLADLIDYDVKHVRQTELGGSPHAHYADSDERRLFLELVGTYPISRTTGKATILGMMRLSRRIQDYCL